MFIFSVGPVFIWCVSQFYSIWSFRKHFIANWKTVSIKFIIQRSSNCLIRAKNIDEWKESRELLNSNWGEEIVRLIKRNLALHHISVTKIQSLWLIIIWLHGWNRLSSHFKNVPAVNQKMMKYTESTPSHISTGLLSFSPGWTPFSHFITYSDWFITQFVLLWLAVTGYFRDAQCLCFKTCTRFKLEAKGNSKVVYWLCCIIYIRTFALL